MSDFLSEYAMVRHMTNDAFKATYGASKTQVERYLLQKAKEQLLKSEEKPTRKKVAKDANEKPNS